MKQKTNKLIGRVASWGGTKSFACRLLVTRVSHATHCSRSIGTIGGGCRCRCRHALRTLIVWYVVADFDQDISVADRTCWVCLRGHTFLGRLGLFGNPAKLRGTDARRDEGVGLKNLNDLALALKPCSCLLLLVVVVAAAGEGGGGGYKTLLAGCVCWVFPSGCKADAKREVSSKCIYSYNKIELGAYEMGQSGLCVLFCESRASAAFV